MTLDLMKGASAIASMRMKQVQHSIMKLIDLATLKEINEHARKMKVKKNMRKKREKG